MLISLIGILEDGSPRGVGVPASAAASITFPQATDVTLRIQVMRPSGEVIRLPASALTVTVKKSPTDSKLIQKTGPSSTVDTTDIAITPADTKNADPGYYVFDAWVTLNGKRDPVIPVSQLYLSPAVTTP